MLARLVFILLVVFFILPDMFSQGCIVYKKDKDGIYLGADARFLSYNIDPGSRQVERKSLSICKIDQVNNIHFAVTGYGANLAMDEAVKIFGSTKEFTQAIEAYSSSFGQKLADMLETTRHAKPEFYQKNFSQHANMGGSVFFYFDNGMLIGRVITIQLISLPTEKATLLTQNFSIDSMGIAGSALGTRNIITKRDIWKNGAVKGINNIINIEKLADPVQVEGVIDILFVSKDNQRKWIQSKRCQ